jgi:hypothetical protein
VGMTTLDVPPITAGAGVTAAQRSLQAQGHCRRRGRHAGHGRRRVTAGGVTAGEGKEAGALPLTLGGFRDLPLACFSLKGVSVVSSLRDLCVYSRSWLSLTARFTDSDPYAHGAATSAVAEACETAR